mmetsp:Transcript_488/g.1679  ORF Transcript_488/g.1679 Transcript_488/m.1679 type:complete len:230 (+) Transcript_488:116-805(+)
MNSRVLALDSGAAGGSSLFSATNSSTSSASCIYSNNHNNRRVGRTSHGSNRRIRVSASLAAPNSTTDSEGSNGLAGAANYAQYACNKVGQAWQSLWGSSEIKGFQQHWYTFAQTMESAFAFNYRHKVTSPTAPPVPETLPHMAAMSTSYPTLHGSHNLDTEALQREELERFLERARNVQPVCDIYNRDGCDLEQCSLQVNELMREAQLRFEASDEVRSVGRCIRRWRSG